MKVSFITTVLNEEESIGRLLESLKNQSRIPDEIIIVDGGSCDQTVANIKYQISNIKKTIKNLKFKIIIKPGNRSLGRNEAIRRATGDIIVASDAGCILEKNWVKNIVEPFIDSKIDVVAGYYRGLARNIFQECLIPYVLVMEDRVNPDEFLPATRSMAFRKSVWETIGGFDEKLSHNEDYDFANRLKKADSKIIFVKDAKVTWIPRKNIREAFIMFFRFALGDSEAKIFRTSVFLVFTRYLIGIYLIFLIMLYKSFFGFLSLIIIFAFYLLWAVIKNYKYVRKWQAIFILPVLQIASDIAVLLGTVMGVMR